MFPVSALPTARTSAVFVDAQMEVAQIRRFRGLLRTLLADLLPCELCQAASNACNPLECISSASRCPFSDNPSLCTSRLQTSPFIYCSYKAVNCSAFNNVCTNFQCSGGQCNVSSPAKSCDDGDTCTLDSCNSTVVGGCVNTPRTDLVAFCPVVTCKTATGCTASQCTYTNRTDLACQCLLNPCSNRTFCSDSTGSCMTSATPFRTSVFARSAFPA